MIAQVGSPNIVIYIPDGIVEITNDTDPVRIGLGRCDRNSTKGVLIKVNRDIDTKYRVIYPIMEKNRAGLKDECGNDTEFILVNKRKMNDIVMFYEDGYWKMMSDRYSSVLSI